MEIDDIRSIVLVLQYPRQSIVACEAANMILNMCYDKKNVILLLAEGGCAPLVRFLSASDPELQACSCGALQSICFQKEGRETIRSLNAVPSIVNLLGNSNRKVQSRAVGLMHNVSSDYKSIKTIRERGAIDILVDLLESSHDSICASATGAIQNVSRELESCAILQSHPKCIPALSALLFRNELHIQSSAVGAILNISGPNSDQEIDKINKRKLMDLLSDSIALGIAYNSIFEDCI
jgi:vacuolar protein 8